MGGTLRRKWLDYCTLKSNKWGNLELALPRASPTGSTTALGRNRLCVRELVAELGSAFLCADLELHQELEKTTLQTLRIRWKF